MAKKKKLADEPKKKTKFKAKARIEDDEDDADDDEGIVGTPKPGNDAYTGLLVISLVCLIAACVFLFMDHGEVTAQTLTAPNVVVPALGNAAPVAAAAPAPAAPTDGN